MGQVVRPRLVNVGTTAKRLCREDPQRKLLRIFNSGTVDICVGPQGVAVDGHLAGAPIRAGAGDVWDNVTAEIWAVTASGSTDVSVLEITEDTGGFR